METRPVRAAVLTGAGGPVRIENFDLPEPGEGGLVIRIELTGICGTDAHIFHGRLPTIEYPALLGHEIVGTIAALGVGVDTDYAGTPVSVGDRVGIFPAISCRQCFTCQIERRPGECANKVPSFGFKSPVGAGKSRLTGGFAEYLECADAGTVFFKSEMDVQRMVLQEPMSIALHAVSRGNVQIGSTVVVQGVGAIGLMVVVAAKAAGASHVVAIGGPKLRGDLALRLGADDIIDLEQFPTPEARQVEIVDRLAGGSADVVIGASGSPQSFVEAIGLVRNGGVISEVGNFTDRGPIDFNPYTDLLRRNITIEGVFGAGSDSLAGYYRALKLLEKGSSALDDVVSHRIPLERVEEALLSLSTGYRLDGRDVVKLAIDPWISSR